MNKLVILKDGKVLIEFDGVSGGTYRVAKTGGPIRTIVNCDGSVVLKEDGRRILTGFSLDEKQAKRLHKLFRSGTICNKEVEILQIKDGDKNPDKQFGIIERTETLENHFTQVIFSNRDYKGDKLC